MRSSAISTVSAARPGRSAALVHEAEDLVQDTCLQLLAKRREIRADDELAYLLTALRNTACQPSPRRRTAPHAVELAAAPEHKLADRHPGADTGDQVGARELMGWISALPEEIRVAVMAVDVAGLSRAHAALRARDQRAPRVGAPRARAPQPRGAARPRTRACAAMKRSGAVMDAVAACSREHRRHH